MSHVGNQHIRTAITVGALFGLTVLTLPAQAQALQVRPDADITINVQRSDEGFLAHEGSSCDRYVSTDGRKENSGSDQSPWDLDTGMSRIGTPGVRVLCVKAGRNGTAYAVTRTLTAQADGTATAPLVLRSDPRNTSQPVLRDVSGKSLLLISGRHHWIIDGLTFDLNRQPASGLVFDPDTPRRTPTHHIGLLNSDMGNSGRGAVVARGQHVVIRGNRIHDNFQPSGADAHGILVDTKMEVAGGSERPTADDPPGPVLIQRNWIHDNGGDGVQCEFYSKDPAKEPHDLVIEDNRMWTSAGNRGRTEQAVDIKECARVSIRGSKSPEDTDPNAADQKSYGFTNNAQGNGRGGGAIVVHIGAHDVVIENNRIWDSCSGIGIGRGDNAFLPTHHVVVRRNLIFSIKKNGSGCDGFGVQVNHATDLDIYHNTIDNVSNEGFRAGPANQTGHPDTNIDFWNNIIRNAHPFVYIWGDATHVQGYAGDYNLYWNEDRKLDQFKFNGTLLSLQRWQQQGGSPAMFVADAHSRVSDPMFIPGAGTTDDYFTVCLSPARDRVGHDTQSRFEGRGPDIGFRESPAAGCSR
jgi:hypothetical protein